LAVILDGFSRKVVGWALERTLTSRLAIAALREAIAKRQPLTPLRCAQTVPIDSRKDRTEQHCTTRFKFASSCKCNEKGYLKMGPDRLKIPSLERDVPVRFRSRAPRNLLIQQPGPGVCSDHRSTLIGI